MTKATIQVSPYIAVTGEFLGQTEGEGSAQVKSDGQIFTGDLLRKWEEAE